MQKVEEKYKKRDPDIRSGDTVKVHLRIVEGGKERIQIFEGVVICVKGSGLGKTFTVRKISHGVGVEKILPVNSPMIKKVDIVERGKVRRSKLYYMRGKIGKRALDVSLDDGFKAIMEEDGDVKDGGADVKDSSGDVNGEDKGPDKVVGGKTGDKVEAGAVEKTEEKVEEKVSEAEKSARKEKKVEPKEDSPKKSAVKKAPVKKEPAGKEDKPKKDEKSKKETPPKKDPK